MCCLSSSPTAGHTRRLVGSRDEPEGWHVPTARAPCVGPSWRRSASISCRPSGLVHPPSDALMAPLGLIERSRPITPGGVFFLNELPRGLGFSILFVAFNA